MQFATGLHHIFLQISVLTDGRHHICFTFWVGSPRGCITRLADFGSDRLGGITLFSHCFHFIFTLFSHSVRQGAPGKTKGRKAAQGRNRAARGAPGSTAEKQKQGDAATELLIDQEKTRQTNGEATRERTRGMTRKVPRDGPSKGPRERQRERHRAPECARECQRAPASARRQRRV